MKLRNKIGFLALLFILVSFSAFGQEEGPKEKHTVFIGINPITVFMSYYEGEVSVAITGLFELGAQISYLDINGFLNLFSNGAVTVTGSNYLLHVGAVARVFPGQDAQGFFLSGRVMMLQFQVEGAPTGMTDFAVGMDIGWRFRWLFEGWGLIFQAFGGIERAILHQETIGIPILPVFGFHFGVCF
jgi:hypothetical protein